MIKWLIGLFKKKSNDVYRSASWTAFGQYEKYILPALEKNEKDDPNAALLPDPDLYEG